MTYVIIDIDRSLRHGLVFWGPNNAGHVYRDDWARDWARVGQYIRATLERDPEYYGRPSVLVVPTEIAKAACSGGEVPWASLLDAARSGRRSLRLLARIVDDALDRREEELDRREAELHRQAIEVRTKNGRLVGRGEVLELAPRPQRRILSLDERERRLDEREAALERAADHPLR